MTSRAAIAQMVSTASVQENLATVASLMEEAAHNAVELIVFPENFSFMGINDTDKFQMAETFGKGPIQEYMQNLAKRYGIWIIAGTLPLKTEGTRISAASLVYDDKGACVARYDKIHMFDVQVSETEAHQESLTIAPGKEIVVIDTPVGKTGLTVCYDLRFPELYQRLAASGAEIFTVPSAFTETTGRAHWEILLRARAIENLCYVLAPNQAGTHENGRKTWGHSMVVQPWGEIQTIVNDTPALGFAEIDRDSLKKTRQRFPCHTHHVLNITG